MANVAVVVPPAVAAAAEKATATALSRVVEVMAPETAPTSVLYPCPIPVPSVQQEADGDDWTAVAVAAVTMY